MYKQTTMTTLIKACVTQLSTSVILMCLLSSWVQTRSLFRDRRAFIYIANETACIVDNIIYHDGDPIPTDDPCESCKCRPPGFSCVLRECKVKPGCKAIRREGECCPEYQCGCEHNGKFFNDGDHIPNAESPCYSCYCQGSSITCALADCKFRFDCEPEYVPNECCPRYEHCQPETPFWTTTSKRPIITRITTMSTAASPAPTTTTTTTTTTTPTPTLASSAIVTSEASQSTSVTATSETSANPEISSPLSPSTTTTISSMSSTLSKDEPVSISTQDEDKTTAPSSMSSASETSPPLSTSSSTTVSSIMVEATTNKLEDETSDTSSVLRTSTSDENTVTSSTISPSTLATNPVSIEDKSESLIPISVASVTTEKASYEPSSENPSESNDEKPSDEASPNETTTLSSLLPESPSTSEKSVESDVTSQSTETVEKVNQEDALTTPSIISSESDSDPGTPTIENKVEVTTISNVETNSEENEPANKVETKPDESEGSEGSEGSGPINNSESDSNSDSSGESKTEEESNSSNVENSDPVATTVSNEMSGETTTVGLEDNYLTTRHWIEDSELRAEHKNGDSDMIVESDLDHPNESPVMPASSSSEGPNYEAMDKLPEEDKTNTKVNLEPETTLNPASTDDHNANAPETFSEISINNSNDSNISSNSNVNNLNSDTSNVNGVGDITITTTISATL